MGQKRNNQGGENSWRRSQVRKKIKKKNNMLHRNDAVIISKHEDNLQKNVIQIRKALYRRTNHHLPFPESSEDTS